MPSPLGGRGSVGLNYFFSVYYALALTILTILRIVCMSLAMDETLTSDYAEKVYHALKGAAPRAAELGERLGLLREKIDGIKSKHPRKEDQLRQFIVAFLGKDQPKRTWRVIVEALKSTEVNLPELAKGIERKYDTLPTLERYI